MGGCARDGRGHRWQRLPGLGRQVSLDGNDGHQVLETCQIGRIARKALSRRLKKPNFVSNVARVCRVSRSKVQ